MARTAGSSWWQRLVPGSAGRALAAGLGDGVWRRAHDRAVRSTDRYHQVLEGVVADGADGAGDQVLPALERTGADLADVLDRVRDLCLRAQELAPSTGLDVPRLPPGSGLPDELHRRLSKVAAAGATAAEAATMARVSARTGRLDVALERALAADRAVRAARAQLGDGS